VAGSSARKAGTSTADFRGIGTASAGAQESLRTVQMQWTNDA
jgi:hypothetical protein